MLDTISSILTSFESVFIKENQMEKSHYLININLNPISNIFKKINTQGLQNRLSKKGNHTQLIKVILTMFYKFFKSKLLLPINMLNEYLIPVNQNLIAKSFQVRNSLSNKT